MGAHVIAGTGSDAKKRAKRRALTRDATAALDALRRIVRALRLSSRALEKDVRLSAAQLFVLQQLAVAPVSSVNDLASRTLTDQSSVSVVVTRLVEKKLARRVASRDDARRMEVSLTARGKRMLSDAPAPAQVRLVDAVRGLPEAELGALARGLTKIVVAMGAASETPTMFFEDEGEAPGPSNKRKRGPRGDA